MVIFHSYVSLPEGIHRWIRMKTDLQNYQFFGFSRALSYLRIGLWPPLSSSLSYHGRWFKENHPILCSTYTIGYFTEPIQLDSMLKGKAITVLQQFGYETTWNCRIPQHYIAIHSPFLANLHQPQALETLKGRFDCSEELREQAEAASNEEKQRNKDYHGSVVRNVQLW